MDINGYEAHKGVLPKSTKLKTVSLDAQVDEWRTVLESLAEGFHSGNARVAPKQYPSTCRYCDQRLLCRLDLTTLEADAIEDLAADSDGDAPNESSEADRG
jgi:ATP-dependent helicase/nuclease subunit B